MCCFHQIFSQIYAHKNGHHISHNSQNGHMVIHNIGNIITAIISQIVDHRFQYFVHQNFFVHRMGII
ncbi:MAG: hypothetical protein WCG25_06620 [bacterium]